MQAGGVTRWSRAPMKCLQMIDVLTRSPAVFFESTTDFSLSSSHPSITSASFCSRESTKMSLFSGSLAFSAFLIAASALAIFSASSSFFVFASVNSTAFIAARAAASFCFSVS